MLKVGSVVRIIKSGNASLIGTLAVVVEVMEYWETVKIRKFDHKLSNYSDDKKHLEEI